MRRARRSAGCAPRAAAALPRRRPPLCPAPPASTSPRADPAMRNFFEPAAAAPPWLRQVLSSIRAALGDIWPAPLRLKDYATADLPAAADFAQGLAWDSTNQTV